MIVTLEEFLAHDGACFDVRTPKEYLHAKIPGALNLPLLSNDERAKVGIAYKHQGKETAIRLGVKLVGPKLDTLLAHADALNPAKKPVRVYCWRGGMRSGFMSYFLQFSGYPTLQLQGGYKAFRRFSLHLFAKPRKLFIIGGLTGSGKTEVLEALKQEKEQILDLEALARHRGSVYGEIVGQAQPSNEHFENELACSLHRCDSSCGIWLEDESRLIGRCQIPGPLYESMKKAPLFVINSSKEARIMRLLPMYSGFSKEFWKQATVKIQKRLGGVNTKAVLASLEQDRLKDGIALLLEYYDRAYQHAINSHQGPVVLFPEQDNSAKAWAKILIDAKRDYLE